jgi:hypothetical protein
MAVYEVELNYTARIIQVVEAENEGEALDKARDLAEEADKNDFTICDERESRILNTR